ncbi:MAG: hypothetical protein VYD19_03830 [Myxococcota bacterium]|nr:hypothetical protein [Myxococcota bacterium]
MKKNSKLFSLIALFTALSLPLSAQALPGIDLSAGLVGGFGTGHPDFGDLEEPEGVDHSLSAYGLGVTLKILMVEAEFNALYHTTTSSGEGTSDQSYSHLALPLIGRLDLSPIPLVSFAIGAGLEPRIFLSQSEDSAFDEIYEGNTLYLPLSLKVGVSIPGVGLGVTGEARYSHQLSPLFTKDSGFDEIRMHNTMFFVGITF